MNLLVCEPTVENFNQATHSGTQVLLDRIDDANKLTLGQKLDQCIKSIDCKCNGGMDGQTAER